MRKLSLSRAWEESRAVLSRDGKLFASVALGIVVLPQTLIGVLAPSTLSARPGLTLLFLTVTMVIGFIAQIALNRLAIGPSTTVGAAIGRGVTRMPVLLASLVLLGIAMTLLLIPLVLLMAGLGLMTTPSGTSGTPGAALALIMAVTLLGYAIFQLAVPVAAAEPAGPLGLLKRSWQLSRGNYLRLLAFVAIMFIGLMIVLGAGQLALGSMIALALGPPDWLSLSALAIALVTALIQALFTVLFAVMLARIYVQLAGGSDRATAGGPSRE